MLPVLTHKLPRRAVLGATDHEMVAVRALLEAAGVPCVDAALPGRDAPRLAGASAVTPRAGDLWVEAAPAAFGGNLDTCGDAQADVGGFCVGCPICAGGKTGIVAAGGRWVDHHAPGDPGFGRPAREAFAASSLGQVWALLEAAQALPGQWVCRGCNAPGDAVEPCVLCGGPTSWVADAPSPHLFATGEADHNLAAFARGACLTGAEDARAFLCTRAGVEEARVQAVIAILRAAPCLPPEGTIFRARIRDLRNVLALQPGTPQGNLLLLAAALCGEGFLGWGTQGTTPQGRHVTWGGTGDGSMLGVQPMRETLTALGCVGVYGDDARGIGGGYLPLT